jgi:hypothetical protein
MHRVPFLFFFHVHTAGQLVSLLQQTPAWLQYAERHISCCALIIGIDPPPLASDEAVSDWVSGKHVIGGEE